MENNYKEESEINLLRLFRKLWKKRLFILGFIAVGLLVGIIIAFSMPKEYQAYVKLSPENINGGRNNQIGGLAAIAGINLGSTMAESDALYPEIYPDIVMSSPFLLELKNIRIGMRGSDEEMTFSEYMLKSQKMPWWSYITAFPFKIVEWVRSESSGKEAEDRKKPFFITKQDGKFIRLMRERVTIDVDKKTGVINSYINMQDPWVAASVLDVIVTNLQQYIATYRTKKAKHNLDFTAKLFMEAKSNYYKIQKEYADYVDANKYVISEKSKTEEERLHNEMLLAYQVYTQMSQQLEMNKVKVQEDTPIYTVIEPAQVPLKPVKPNKMMIMLCWAFLAALGSCGWIILKGYYVEKDILDIRKNI